jgi:integrating conjugative element protein (TIGR03759 family)
MNRAGTILFIVIALVATTPAFAIENATTQVEETGQDNSSTETTTLSAADRARSHLWSLSESEWNRYQTLMQGIRGSISPPTISPIEVLGIHARDDAERQRYAVTWARAMHEDAERILAFQHAYDLAVKHLYSNEPLIDVTRLPDKTEDITTFQSDDRLLFFTRPECPACDVLMNQLLKKIDVVSGIDIYLRDIAPGDDAAVRAWASTHQIEPDWVRSRRITLNHDGGALDKLMHEHGEVPSVFRRRGEDVIPLRVADL